MLVNVVLAGGARHSVRLTPHTTVGQILEEVCANVGLEADNYSLRYEDKVLDNHCRLHYACLSEGTDLEMVELAGADSGTISVSLEVNCLRFVGSFTPDDNLMNVVTTLCPTAMLNRENSFPAVTLSQHKIVGVHRLQQTTFNMLGIDRGNIAIRVEIRDAGAIAGPSRETVTRGIQVDEQERVVEAEEENQSSTASEEPTAKEDNNPPLASSAAIDDFPYLGDRNLMLFPVPDDYSVPVDPLDEFYEVHFDEEGQRLELENRPKMAETMRLLDEQKELKLKYYKKSVIRVQFPNRIILQGVFDSDELVESVYDFVKNNLEDPELGFYLYTSPPKLLLEPSKRLVDVDCVPLASIYFGLTNRLIDVFEFVRIDFMRQMTTYEIATAAAVVIRSKKEDDECDETYDEYEKYF